MTFIFLYKLFFLLNNETMAENKIWTVPLEIV